MASEEASATFHMPAEEAKERYYVRALYDYSAERPVELSMSRGQKLCLLSDTETNGWAYVEAEALDGTRAAGWVPYSYLSMSADNPLATDWQDDEYFSSYDTIKLHSEMLSDVPRTATYRDAIESNAKFLAGGVVLDVGAGTGVLSMFAARDGKAAKVIGVEASPFAENARVLVKHNNLDSHVEIVQCRVEQAHEYHALLGTEDENKVIVPNKCVDAIISEWMGTMLVFELMIESVIHARNMFLKPGGAMFPGWCQLYLAPACVPEHVHRHVGVFHDVFGLSFEPLVKDARNFAASKLIFNFDLKPEHLLVEAKDAVTLLELDLHTCSVKDLEEFGSPFRFVCTKDGPLHGFASWWDTTFPACDSRDVANDDNKHDNNNDGKEEQPHNEQVVVVVDDNDNKNDDNNKQTDNNGKIADNENNNENNENNNTDDKINNNNIIDDNNNININDSNNIDNDNDVANKQQQQQPQTNVTQTSPPKAKTGHAKGIILSTAADKPSTHWKQDLMLLKEPIACKQGDVIVGKILCTRNPFWRRHLLIELQCAIEPQTGPPPVYQKASYTIWRS